MIQTIKNLLLEAGITLITITDIDPILRNSVKDRILTDPIKGTYTTYIIRNDFPRYNPNEPVIYLVNETYGSGHFKFFSIFNISDEKYKQNRVNLSAALPDIYFSNPEIQQRFLAEKSRSIQSDVSRRKANEFFKTYGGSRRRSGSRLRSRRRSGRRSVSRRRSGSRSKRRSVRRLKTHKRSHKRS